jgi:hypothetical protein
VGARPGRPHDRIADTCIAVYFGVETAYRNNNRSIQEKERRYM